MKFLRLAVVCAAVMIPFTASAAPITFEFTGTATIANGMWANQGTDVTGWFTYDTDLIPTVNSVDTNTFLSNNVANAGLHYELAINVGGASYFATEADGLFNFGLFDKATDQYSFVGPGGSLVLFGSDPSAITGLNGTVPTTAPDLSLFQSAASAGRVGTELKFTITSITARPVPEPAAALLFAVGSIVISAALRRRQLG